MRTKKITFEQFTKQYRPLLRYVNGEITYLASQEVVSLLNQRAAYYEDKKCYSWAYCTDGVKFWLYNQSSIVTQNRIGRVITDLPYSESSNTIVILDKALN